MNDVTFEQLGELRIDLQMGRVDVVATPRHDISVHVAPANERRAGDRAAAEAVRTEQVADAVVVSGPFRHKIFGPGDSVDLIVQVPEGTAVTLGLKYGTARFTGRLGRVAIAVAYGDTTLGEVSDLEVDGGHGDLRATLVAGEATITKKSGDVRIDRVDGAVSFSTSDASLHIASVGGPLKGETSTGRIDLGTVADNCTLRSAYANIQVDELIRGVTRVDGSYGSVHLGIRPGTSVWVDAHSEHDSVRTDLTADSGPAEQEETLELHLRTGYGHISVRRSDPH